MNKNLDFQDPPGYFYWKDCDGFYHKASQQFLELLNIKEIVGKKDTDLWPNDAQKINYHDQIVIKSNNSITVEESITIRNVKKTFLVTRSPWKDKEDNIIGIIANLCEITCLKEQEEKLIIERNSISANLESLMVCTPGSIYWKDKNGVYLGCNDYMVQEAGLNSRSEIIGKTDEDLWPTQSAPIRENDLEVMLSGKSLSLEETVTDRVFFSLKMPLRDEAKNIIGVICNSHDITYLKEVEAQLRKANERLEAMNQMKTEFIAIVSHELRSPLTSILGMVHFLTFKENMSSVQRKEYINNISIAANHLLMLVNDILDFVKLEAGKFELSVAPLNLKQLISEMISIFMPQALTKEIDMFLDYPQNIPHMVHGDSRALRQVFINLLSNAIKFTETGYISIKVESVNQTENNVALAFSIIDTGIGIPPDKLSIIFDDFQQVDPSYQRKYGGTGLGLTITKKIIHMMDSTLEVESKENKGSTFRFVINFQLQTKSIVEHPWLLYQGNVSILIVDDSLRGDIIRKQIGPGNCQVTSSQEALNVFIANQQSIPFGIVIIDDKINALAPYQLAQMISEYATVPQPMLVYLTSSPSLKIKDEALNAGFFDCILKQLAPLEFQTSLTAAWERWIEKVGHNVNYSFLNVQKNSLPAYSTLETQEKESNTEGRKKVLLIDDEKVVLLVHSEYLRDLGCFVDTVNDSESALKILENDSDYDIIFVDMGLPGISGPDLVKSRRKKEHALQKRTPLIALTGFSSEKDRATFLEAGVDEVLIKPVVPDQLLKVLKKYEVL